MRLLDIVMFQVRSTTVIHSKSKKKKREISAISFIVGLSIARIKTTRDYKERVKLHYTLCIVKDNGKHSPISITLPLKASLSFLKVKLIRGFNLSLY